ncbi:MAG: rhomboid family intramembrane serine protease [Bryobacterales bacterium]|nr:rhomboid family intramembrane serine protease [Bryobacterales bacterium]
MPAKQRAIDSTSLAFALVCVIWAVFAVDALFPVLGLHRYGIHPRTLFGLAGILFAPLLHAGLYHVAVNTVPLFVMLVLLHVQSAKRAGGALVQIWLLTGLGSWLIGRSGFIHIGASGLVYGLLTYLIAAGFYQRDWKSILIGGVVLFSYGGLLWRILPTYWFISWEAHLCGAVAGVLVASWTRRK